MKCLYIAMLIAVGSQNLMAADSSLEKGQCKLETSNEVIQLQNQDPLTHFGSFAIGKSQNGDRIILSNRHNDEITVELRTQSGSSYSIFEKSKTDLTKIKTGIFVKTFSGANEWLTCDLEVK